jgi:DNA-binding response OmpR family regulator
LSAHGSVAGAYAPAAWIVADPGVYVGDLLAELAVLGFAACRVSASALASESDDPAVVLVVGSGAHADTSARRACTALRARPPLSGVPIVVVMSAGRIPVADAVLDAHELIVRPLRAGELVSRVERAVAASRARDVAHLALCAGVLQLEPHSRIVRIDGRPVAFGLREFELLAHLVRHPIRVHSRAQLLRAVWCGEEAVGTRAVDVQVRRVRAKLGDDLSACIRTVRRVGYAFTAPG